MKNDCAIVWNTSHNHKHHLLASSAQEANMWLDAIKVCLKKKKFSSNIPVFLFFKKAIQAHQDAVHASPWGATPPPPPPKEYAAAVAGPKYENKETESMSNLFICDLE